MLACRDRVALLDCHHRQVVFPPSHANIVLTPG
jgi:hypothetical protein